MTRSVILISDHVLRQTCAAFKEGMATTSDEERKRKQQRACDICHKRKIRCDGVTNGQCSTCISLNVRCTRTERRKRGPKSKQEVEIEGLRKQVEYLKQQVSVLKAQLSLVHSSLVPPVTQYPAPPTPPSDTSTPEVSFCVADSATDGLAERLREFSLDADRFFGPSSDFMLMKNAVTVKEEYLGRPSPLSPLSNWKRPEFWTVWPWEKASAGQTPQYVFPPSDLMAALLELYFSNLHLTLPLLHRPSFERSVRDNLHLRDHQFGALVLVVLALGSRFSDDPRVLVPGTNTKHSSGWVFFEQLETIKKSLHDVPSIYEVQLYCLMTSYVHGTSSPQASWALGIRFLQERGEHWQKREGRKLTIEHELWNRAFWCLFSLDTGICACVGRPSAIHTDDYDVDLLLEVDDEYFEHPDPEQAFKQPAGKPSRLSYFAQHIRLCEILSSALRLLYASNRLRMRMGWVGRDWQQRAIAELDSAMNEFIGSLPDHLRWDPDRQGDFFDQSAAINTMYHQLQITIHRPQIHVQTPMAFPSLAICTRAARTCVNIVDVWLTRAQRVLPSLMQSASFVSGIMLLLNVFSAKRTGWRVVEVEKDLAHVETAMLALKFMEQRYQTAGRAWELLQELRSRDVGPGLKVATSSTKASTTRENPTSVSGSVVAAVPEPWNKLLIPSFSSQSNPAPSAVDMSIEQLLAATAGYDNGGSVDSARQWGDITRLDVGDTSHGHGGSAFDVELDMLVNNPVPMDDEVMSMWMAAPSGFGDLDQWHSYITMENAPGFNWSNFELEATDPELGSLQP
ncbi:fungal-specific transcription factor domain-containing protein [Mycena crocata]|nr:fungal-specific transcription factor domain-containing protein [Mycena crocata]